MYEIIKITEIKGTKLVDARELHSFLLVATDFKDWMPRMLEYGFEIDKDFSSYSGESKGGRPSKEYCLTLDCAKEISMIQRSERGKQARQYFIECEKQLNKPKTQIELIIESAQLLKAIEEKQNVLEQRIEIIENRPQINAPIEHFSILGYCHNIGKQISHNEALSYGRKCAKQCKEFGYIVGKISDARYGAVNTYPLDVLKEIIL